MLKCLFCIFIFFNLLLTWSFLLVKGKIKELILPYGGIIELENGELALFHKKNVVNDGQLNGFIDQLNVKVIIFCAISFTEKRISVKLNSAEQTSGLSLHKRVNHLAAESDNNSKGGGGCGRIWNLPILEI